MPDQFLATYRRAHTGRLPIPQRLWTAAVELAREHGIFHTAKALRLDYSKLKQLLESSGAVKRSGATRAAGVKSRRIRSEAPPSFMELLASPTAAAVVCPQNPNRPVKTVLSDDIHPSFVRAQAGSR